MKPFEIIIPLASAIIGVFGALGGVLLAKYIQKPDFEVTTKSCSQKGPEEAWIEHLGTGEKRKVDNADIPASLDRVTSIENTGSKTIDGADLHINIENPVKARIMQETVFFESALSKHEILASDDGSVLRISLKDFNPSDKISILTTSTRTIGISVIGKMSGLTINTTIKRDQSCGFFGGFEYGGVIAYQKLDNDCEIPPETMNLSCKQTFSIPTPKDMPPGPARLIFK